LSYLARGFGRHAQPQRVGRVGRLEGNPYRNALRDFHEVAGRILGRNDAERVLRRRRDRFEPAGKRDALVRIDGNLRRLSDPHLAELGLFIIRRHIHMARGNDDQDRLSGAEHLTDLDVFCADVTCDRCEDLGRGELVLRRAQLRLGLDRLRPGRIRGGLLGHHAVRRRALSQLALGGRERTLLDVHLRLAAAGRRLLREQLLASRGQVGLRGGDRGLCLPFVRLRAGRRRPRSI